MNTLSIAPPGSTMTETDRTGLSRDALRRAFLDNLFYVQGKFPGAGHPQRLLHGAGLHGARPPAAALDQHRGRPTRGRARAPCPTCRPSSCWGRTSATTWSTWASTTQVQQAMARAGPRLRRAARAGGGARPGQRRPGPAGGLLPGLAGHAGDPGHRLRHPLRVRHLRPGDPRRLAGREDRQVAALRQSVGDRRGPNGRSRSSFGGHTERYADEHGRDAGALGARHAGDGHRPTTRRSSATASTPPTRCGCGAPRRRSRSTSRPSTAATTTAR